MLRRYDSFLLDCRTAPHHQSSRKDARRSLWGTRQRLFHVVDIEGWHAVAVLGGVIQKLTKSMRLIYLGLGAGIILDSADGRGLARCKPSGGAAGSSG